MSAPIQASTQSVTPPRSYTFEELAMGQNAVRVRVITVTDIMAFVDVRQGLSSGGIKS